MTSLPTPTNVVVIGGGYAGTLAANRMLTRRDVSVTLVNPRPWFVERIRLHQLVADSGSATVDFADMLNPDVHLVVDTATEIDVAGRRVRLASGSGLRYDYLIYAVGSTAVTPTVPGASEFAYQIADFEQAQALRQRIGQLHPNAPIAIVGAGPTGIEMASELAERRPAGTVTLVCGGVLGPYFSDNTRRSVAKRLRKLGVTLVEDATVVDVHADHVRLDDGRRLPSAATVWTVGFSVPELAARSGLSTDGLGRLLTDETLTSVDDRRIVGTGDATAPSGQPLRMSCQAAIPLGAQAADTVLSRIAGSEPRGIDQAFTGMCLSLGREHGTVQLSRRDDTARPLYLAGRLAASVKELVCKSTVWAIAREGRNPGSYFWLKGGNPRPAIEMASVR